MSLRVVQNRPWTAIVLLVPGQGPSLKHGTNQTPYAGNTPRPGSRVRQL